MTVEKAGGSASFFIVLWLYRAKVAASELVFSGKPILVGTEQENTRALPSAVLPSFFGVACALPLLLVHLAILPIARIVLVGLVNERME